MPFPNWGGAAGHRQRHKQAEGQRLVSPYDVTYLLASLLMSGIQIIPASRRIQLFDKAIPPLARLLQAADVLTTRAIRRNLERLFGADRPLDVIEMDVRRQLSMTIWNSLVMSTLPALNRGQVEDLVPVKGISTLDKCLAGKHPVLVLGYHFGIQPLIVAAVLRERGYPIHAITHVTLLPDKAGVLGRLYFHQLSHVYDKLPIIDPREGVRRRTLDILRNKEWLYLTPDYMLLEEARQPKSAFEVPIDLLGRRAYVQTGGIRLAKRYKAKAVTVLCAVNERGQRQLIVEPLVLPTSGLKPDELQQDVQACMNRLESQLLAHPYLWLDLKRDDLTRRLKETPSNES
jgi:lauroyl/myristoyl acyltransferase